MTRTIAAIIATLMLPVTGMASNVTIDFEEFEFGTYTPVTSQGFTFDGAGFDEGIYPARIGWANSSQGLLVSASSQSEWSSPSGADMGFERIDGQAFALHYLEYEIDAASGGIRGRRTSDGAWFGTETAAVGTGDWLNIDAVVLSISVYCNFCGDSGYAYGEGWFDNIVVGSAVVPLPAAIWLFGSGLLGLAGWGRHRRRVRLTEHDEFRW